VLDGEHNSNAAAADPALIKAIARGHCWFEILAGGDFGSMRELASAEGVSERFVAQQMQLAFIAPALVDRFLDAAGPPTMPAKRLALMRQPIVWSDQMNLSPAASYRLRRKVV
jgi:site-specific DNA recombinase